jgi:hypothetical protein
MGEPVVTIHPDAPKGDAEFQQKLEQFKALLSGAEELHALAMHEAGHEFYYRQMGITGFDYYGPSAGPGENDFFGASIDPTSWTDDFIHLESLTRIHLAARANTAGGSVTKFVVKRSDRGNHGDFKGFVAASSLVLSDHKLTLDLRAVWNKAEIETDREVRRLATKEKIKKIAVRIKPLLFTWLE